MPSAPHHALLLGGHGKIAQLLTPLLLRRGWDVTSVIRTETQVPTIQALAPKDGDDGTKGKLKVLVRSLEEVKSEGDAGRVIAEWGGDYVVWSAGECTYCSLFLFFSFLFSFPFLSFFFFAFFLFYIWFLGKFLCSSFLSFSFLRKV